LAKFCKKVLEQSNLNSVKLFDFVLLHVKQLIYFTIISLVVFTIIAILLPSKYRSTVVLFPATSESVSKSLLSESQQTKGLLNFGTAEEVDQFLQVLYSDEIRSNIIKKYALFSHYDIDSTQKYPYTKLYNKYEENISFRRTEFLSIIIEVFDKDPKFSSDIANDIASYADSAINKMQHERAKKAFELVSNEYYKALKDLTDIQDTLTRLRNLGVYNYEAQSEVYSDAYAQAVAKGNKAGVRDLDEKFKILAQYGGTYQNYNEMVTNETKRLSMLKQKFAEAQIDAQQNIPHKFIVSNAEIPEKEYYPIRWLIVLGGVLSSDIFGIIILAFIELLKKKRKL